jgi:hypothetical protein
MWVMVARKNTPQKFHARNVRFCAQDGAEVVAFLGMSALLAKIIT